MPPATIIKSRWNFDETYSAIPTQDPELVAAEKHRVVEQLHSLGHIRELVKIQDLTEELTDLDEIEIENINNGSFFAEIKK